MTSRDMITLKDGSCYQLVGDGSAPQACGRVYILKKTNLLCHL